MPKSYRCGIERPHHLGRGQRFVEEDDLRITGRPAQDDPAESRRRGLQKNRNGDLKLLQLTNRVRDLLQITKLYTVFDVFSDENTALRSFE
jgi:hypothetical protein